MYCSFTFIKFSVNFILNLPHISCSSSLRLSWLDFSGSESKTFITHVLDVCITWWTWLILHLHEVDNLQLGNKPKVNSGFQKRGQACKCYPSVKNVLRDRHSCSACSGKYPLWTFSLAVLEGSAGGTGWRFLWHPTATTFHRRSKWHLRKAVDVNRIYGNEKYITVPYLLQKSYIWKRSWCARLVTEHRRSCYRIQRKN